MANPRHTPAAPSLSQAYAEALEDRDGRHPDPPYFDPANDPGLSLRVVHSYAESIQAADKSEDRYQAKARRRQKHNSQFFSRVASKLSTRRPHRHAGQAQKDALHPPVPSPHPSPNPNSQNDSFFSGAPDADDTQAASPSPLVAANASEPSPAETASGPDAPKKGRAPPSRRRVYVNLPLPASDLDKHGEPKTLYARNKVRTSKYTILSFLPKFLFEQFRRIANIYFLILIFLQMRVEFTAGASVPQISMLPLVAILAITAIKDGIEDSRRHLLDNGVNNEQVTRLGGGWRNVNQPSDARSWFRRLLGLSSPRSPVKPSKGVRKLRAAHHGDEPIALQKLSASSGDGNGIQGGESDMPLDQDDLGRGDETYGPYAPDAGQSRHNLLLEPLPMLASRSGSTAVDPPSSLAPVVDPLAPAPGTAVWERTLWKKVEVGDILVLQEDQEVPADLVVLATSEEDGQAYVETKNLDGETNLKPRRAVRATMGIQSEADLERARFVVDAEPPHPNLYAFNGVLEYTHHRTSLDNVTPTSTESSSGKPDTFDKPSSQLPQGKVEPVTINELLLRGCTLRNTRWVVGLVLFTGSDTKIMLNSGETPSKRSKIEKETNFNVLVNFIILVLMCLVCGICGGIFSGKEATSRTYYEQNSLYGSTAVLNGIILFFSTMIAFQNIVPISLYISIEIVKTIQAWFIFRDLEMYYAPLDYPCVPKSWNIADDLGQIEYVFSDKTGTLTQNVMEFKKCSVSGIAYGDGMTEAMVGSLRRQGKLVTEEEMEQQEVQLAENKEAMVNMLHDMCPNKYLQPEQMTIVSVDLARTLCGQVGSKEREDSVLRFFRALALCHTALVDQSGNKVEYKAESPDEAALVAAARDMGCVFLKRNNHEVEIEVQGRREVYEPLQVLAFNSTRKRMSIILRETTGERRVLLLIKGADSVIYERLALDHDPELKSQTTQDLESFANAGLRTLCVAYKYLSEQEYTSWAKGHADAEAALTDRDDKVDASSEEIEQGLYLLGATALEDKLQQGVPDAIAQLRRAGIKIWILTGDKLQTAIEIGFSCNLLSTDMDIFIISSESAYAARTQIEEACDKVAAAGRPIKVQNTTRPAPVKSDLPRSPPKDGFAVVIDGETLKWALDKDLKELFLGLTTQCEAVVCCRVSPAQKAQVVRLVKQGRGSMTLAIGDGANDVAMIQEAHCGVGIAGREGAQAAMSADYAIGQFRFLVRLLLVHGHWSVVRIARMHCVFFFKNLIWTLVLAWFQIMVEFDGTYLVPYPFILLFNLVFTSLPSIILGALDQDVNAAALMAVPEAYAKGISGQYYTRRIFFEWVFDAVYQSAICFFIPWAMVKYFAVSNSQGHDMGGMYLFGMTVAGASVTCANLVAAIISNYWTWLFWVIEVGSIVVFYLFAAIYSAFNSFIFDDVAFWLYGSIFFWATLFLTMAASLLPRFVYHAWHACFLPDDGDIVREQWVAGDLKDRLGRAHRNARRAAKRQRRLGLTGSREMNDDGPSSRGMTADLENPPPPLSRSGSGAQRRSGDSLADFVEGYRLGPAWTRDRMSLSSTHRGPVGPDPLSLADTNPAHKGDDSETWGTPASHNKSVSSLWNPRTASESTLGGDDGYRVVKVDDVPPVPALPKNDHQGIRLVDSDPDQSGESYSVYPNLSGPQRSVYLPFLGDTFPSEQQEHIQEAGDVGVGLGAGAGSESGLGSWHPSATAVPGETRAVSGMAVPIPPLPPDENEEAEPPRTSVGSSTPTSPGPRYHDRFKSRSSPQRAPPVLLEGSEGSASPMAKGEAASAPSRPDLFAPAFAPTAAPTTGHTSAPAPVAAGPRLSTPRAGPSPLALDATGSRASRTSSIYTSDSYAGGDSEATATTTTAAAAAAAAARGSMLSHLSSGVMHPPIASATSVDRLADLDGSLAAPLPPALPADWWGPSGPDLTFAFAGGEATPAGGSSGSAHGQAQGQAQGEPPSGGSPGLGVGPSPGPGPGGGAGAGANVGIGPAPRFSSVPASHSTSSHFHPHISTSFSTGPFEFDRDSFHQGR